MATEGPAELRELLGEDAMRRFLRVYLSESKRRLHEMVEGVVEGDAPRVRDAVHALLPTSRWVGATDVARLCDELHRREDWTSLTKEHADLVLRIADLHSSWERELEAALPDVVPVFLGAARPIGPSFAATR